MINIINIICYEIQVEVELDLSPEHLLKGTNISQFIYSTSHAYSSSNSI